MIPVFVISLTRSLERREMAHKQMSHLGIDYCFFDAVDGRNITEKDTCRVDLNEAVRFSGHELSPGEIGCALSHINVYEMMIDKGIERCVILEDDAYLHMHFKKIVEAITACDNSEIVFLHHGKAKKWPILRALPEGYRLAKYRVPSKNSKRAVLSAAGYILTLAGAKKLLSHAYPVRMPADYLTGRLQLNKLNASGVEPCCLDVDWLPTTIEDRAYGHYLDDNKSGQE
ncbi:glycosyltransferase family 25 protein [Aeromonas schubertii]|uniref:glycosyltransferase family 25 protein n=1 Tax=Aeromonas schubertii TaxID=652 RepID=UPI0010A8B906|nr:glycosyltransferase family 25 protein [Aeromonas schubertii]QCG49758.1 glycosyltransferase family 25 protein [Aeromonas schubertii]